MTKLIRPLFYHWRGKSDCGWVISRMKVIPESRRREVSDHYENLFLRNEGGTGRKDANEYLYGVASEYRAERKQESRAKLDLDRILHKKPQRKGDRKYVSGDGLWSKEL
jgi:hypothetical protein